MKKIIAMLLALVMVLSLAACSSGTPASDTQKDESAPATETIDQSAETQQTIDNVNNYVLNAAGNRKLSSNEITTALGVAMQIIAAGADPLTELKEVQSIADSLE